MEKTIRLNIIELSGGLAESKVFDQISFFVDLIKDGGSRGDTYRLVRDLEHLLQVNKEQLGTYKQKYEDMLINLRLDSFQLLSDEEIGDILQHKMSVAQKLGIDLIRSASLIFVPYFTQDDYTRISSMIRYLENNRELIGGDNIAILEGKVAGPIVSNWLKDYKFRTPEDKGSLNLVTYITQSNNCKKLNEEQLEFLKYILTFYDWLRFKASKTSFVTEEVDIEGRSRGSSANVVTPTVPKPISIPTPKPVSDFDQKLTQVSAPAHGRDLEVLREQLVRGEGTNAIKMTPEEIKREVTEIELPGHKEEIASSSRPRLSSNQIDVGGTPRKDERSVVPPPKAPLIRTNLQSLAQISMVDDLKKIEIAHLRQGPLAQQLQTIRSKIFSIAQANRLYPYYTVSAFEQSPLFRAYLQTGSSKITENKTEGGLSQAEFEAIADFKKEIERL